MATDDAPPDFHLAASGFDPTQGLFTDLVSYFGRFDRDFQDTLQGQEQTVESVAETFTGGVALQTLAESPMASLDDAARDDLFKKI